MNDAFITRGGLARIDRDAIPSRRRTWKSGWNATWPFATLRVDAETVDVSSMFGGIHITRMNLVTISRFLVIPVMSDGFKFVATDQDDAVVFWSLNSRVVLRQLNDRGWVVSTTGRRT